MKATLMYGAGDVRVEDVPDPVILAPTDAVVRVVRSAICGSDLHPYRSMPAGQRGRRMGHEFLGIIEDTGAEVTGLRRGDLVLSPFTYADNTCFWCRTGLQTSCPHGGRYGFPDPAGHGVDGGQGEAVRVPQASGTLVGVDDPARHYIDGILPDVLEGRIEPGRVFDRIVGLNAVPDSYRAMADR